MRIVGIALLTTVMACAKTSATEETEAASAAATTAPVEAPVAETKTAPEAPAELSEGKLLLRPIQPGTMVVDDPAKAYEECKTRVEGSDTEGECSADGDCVATGCSKELCVSKTVAGDGLVSPCEVLPCFSVLDTCGCNSGTCQWSVKQKAE